MEVITMDSQAYKSLVGKIDRILACLKKQAGQKQEEQPCPEKQWLTNAQACDALEVSPRTLQRMRTGGQIAYSLRGGKARYTRAEIDRAMSGRVYGSTGERGIKKQPR